MKYKELLFPFDKSKKLSNFSTNYTANYKDNKAAEKDLKRGIKKMRKLQYKMYAHDKYSLLLIFQAMDAAGKDGTIKHVMNGINPQGCMVSNFKKPSSEELDHDYLWRCVKKLPRKGNIGIFNRSYYEELLIVRVHPKILSYQKLPNINGTTDPGEAFWQNRFEDINNFEKYIAKNNTIVLKFFLNVSKKEQKNRFIARIDNPEKNWKFAMGDVEERKFWNKYQKAYEQVLLNTSTKYAPWYVIPADNKWFMRTAVSEIIVDKLENTELHFPKISAEAKQELQEARKSLIGE